ncbi:hypothetical protein SGQ83_07635 [Flavobacterium sp. Fl-318]|uniref:Uncharacterized protein n=1 Tax=Flavobacterium cupriresistens TaxID=2893885 RepID=A0ABU4RB30_9FLAO|nr:MULTISPECIES: hypothetical protein [unclassified Flavobacterium]MDX6189213.1 hypothetical protein [Flavobacterium sp. Fl-318]UFH41309.1 hypothetical protein LNP23_16005 [Flavobacterium sp. F-323]
MASSFVNFENNGFWARDGFVEAMQLCLINEIEDQKLDSIEWINEFKSELALQSFPMIIGGMSLELEEFITHNERKIQLVQLIDLIIVKIALRDNYMTGANLHEMRKRAMNILSETAKMEFKTPEELEEAVYSSGWILATGIVNIKEKYQHSFKLLKMLIEGEIKTTASSPDIS